MCSLDRLQVKCKYFNIGCTDVQRLENIQQHEAICERKNLVCKNCELTVDNAELKVSETIIAKIFHM